MNHIQLRPFVHHFLFKTANLSSYFFHFLEIVPYYRRGEALASDPLTFKFPFVGISDSSLSPRRWWSWRR
jgi:hypothetical protein